MSNARMHLLIAFIPFAAFIAFALADPQLALAQAEPSEGAAKKLIPLSGGQDTLANRYWQPDCVRSGCPKSLGLGATPSMSAKYSAGYAGGSTSLNSLHSRPRTPQEGTWGLDYTLWGNPKLAWLRWGDGNRRQSNGNFETDR